MSIDRDPGVFYGTCLSQEAIEAMMVTIPRKAEMVPCYDKHSGERLPDEENVINDEYQALVIDGKRYGCTSQADGYLDEGIDALAKKVGLYASVMQEDRGDVYGYVIGMGCGGISGKTMTKRICAVDVKLKKLPKLIKALNGPCPPAAKVHAFMILS